MDVLRYYHGDGPARQFEAGNNIGGDDPCTGCGVESSLFDDIVHGFRSKPPPLLQRQGFILKGNIWKQSLPLDKLYIIDYDQNNVLIHVWRLSF